MGIITKDPWISHFSCVSVWCLFFPVSFPPVCFFTISVCVPIRGLWHHWHCRVGLLVGTISQVVDLLLRVSLMLRSILHEFVTKIRAALLSSLNGIWLYFENLAKVDNGFECGHSEWHIDVIDNLQLVRGSDIPFLASLCWERIGHGFALFY